MRKVGKVICEYKVFVEKCGCHKGDKVPGGLAASFQPLRTAYGRYSCDTNTNKKSLFFGVTI